jgi:hypothetical protein
VICLELQIDVCIVLCIIRCVYAVAPLFSVAVVPQSPEPDYSDEGTPTDQSDQSSYFSFANKFKTVLTSMKEIGICFWQLMCVFTYSQLSLVDVVSPAPVFYLTFNNIIHTV